MHRIGMQLSNQFLRARKQTLVFMVGLGTCVLFGCSRNAGTTSPPPETTTSLTFPHPQTFCMGRMRLTVPGPGASMAMIGSDIDGVALRTDELPKGKTFARARKNYKDTLAQGVETTVLERTTYSPTRVGLITASDYTKAFGPDVKPTRNHVSIWQNEGSHTLAANTYPKLADTKAGVERTLNVLDHYRMGDLAAASNRFCIGSGAIVDLKQGGEGVWANIDLKLPPFYKLPLYVQTDQVIDTQSDNLLERMKHQEEPPGTTLLRRGERTVTGMHGHEYVDAVPSTEWPGETFFGAAFEFGGVADSVLQPRTTIGILGTRLPNSYRPQDLLAMWNAILNSISITEYPLTKRPQWCAFTGQDC